MGWRVHSCSSESPVHSAGNVVLEELYRIWQTKEPCDEAWLILEAEPPTPFDRLEIVNAGSSLLEVYGWSIPEEGDDERGEEEEELLLSTQQVMTLKDLTNKCNRNRSFTYTVPQKLSPIAARKRMLTPQNWYYFFWDVLLVHIEDWVKETQMFGNIYCVEEKRIFGNHESEFTGHIIVIVVWNKSEFPIGSNFV